ncbi:MAG: efflux RND transporter periplasmic adaptor subunit [Simkaniaceae bacterium]|nr:efflux RND transporter periplasmic adaptor subunit [Simkaniaceae bacterium]MCF7852721.1 efflux RND transporter periplasmic adaptor subunit [Simkaniaceae bacterium]
MNKWIAFSILTCALTSACSKKEETKPTPPIVEVIRPVKRTVPIYIDAPGHIEPIQSVDIKPQVSGEIIELHYEEGTYVTEGDLLISIDDRHYIAQKNKAEGELVQNQAELQYAQETLARNKPLVSEDFISKDQFDKLTSNVGSLEGSILMNLAEIQDADVSLGYCSIRAPISGLLGAKRIDKGNIVSAYSDMTMVTINQISPIWDTFAVDEKYLAHIHQERSHHPLRVEIFEKRPSEPIAIGHLVFIDNQVNDKTGQIMLKGHFENQDQVLWPGQYVKTRLILSEKPDAILVPSSCVMQSKKGDYVFVVNSDHRVERREVVIGLRQDDGEMIMILKGVSLQDQVVVKGQINISQGMSVQIKSGSHPSS